MARLGDILQRFRFHGVPGAAAAAAVPVDRFEALDRELAPVFDALAPARARCEAMLEDARTRAAQRREAGAAEAGRILAQAHGALAGVRATAFASRVDAAQAEGARLVAAARTEADRIAAVAPGRIAEATDEVVANVVRQLESAS